MKHLNKFNESLNLKDETFNEEEFRSKITTAIAGEWHSIKEIVDLVPIDDLIDIYSHMIK